MSPFVLPLVAIFLVLPLSAWSGEVPLVTLGGEVGAAADACINRFRAAPFDSLPWLRADLTGEQVSEFDKQWGHLMSRPFKQYSGDISGRFIEITTICSRTRPPRAASATGTSSAMRMAPGVSRAASKNPPGAAPITASLASSTCAPTSPV